MFVALSTYLVPLEQVDRLRGDHIAFLQRLAADGRLITAGRQDPPVGGVLLLRGDDVAEMDQLLAGDPYAQAGVARYTLTRFSPGAYSVRD